MKTFIRFAVLSAFSLALSIAAVGQTASIELKDGSGTLINSYNSVTTAVAAIPSTITQAYVIEITSTYTGANEAYPIVFPAITGASATNTITLRPASGVTNAKIETSITSTVIRLSDADYVRLDGRPGGIGTSKGLTISNTTTSASTTIEFINGATNNILRYLNIANGTSGSTGRAIYINSSTNVSGNSDNLFEHNKIDGGRYNVQFGGTTANPNKNNTFYGNEFLNLTYAGLYSTSGANKMVVLDSNSFHVTVPSTSTAITSAIFFSSFSDTAIITRNKIYDISLVNTSSSDVNGMYLSPSTGASITIVNNFISLDGNPLADAVNGIYILGSGGVDAKAYYNTVRIGGTYASTSGSSGTVRSAAIHKTNSSTASIFDFQNNILVNARTGGVSGSQHIALAVPNTNGTITAMDYNVYNAATNEISRLGTVVNTSILDHQTTFGGGIGLNSNNSPVQFVSNADLHIAGGSLGDFDLKATPILSVKNDIDNDPRGGSTYKGADDNPSFPILGKKNEIGVISINEPLAGNCNTNQKVSVTVRNFGINQVDTFTINWSINGVIQTPIKDYSVLDTVLGTGSLTAQVSLGSFTSTSGTLYAIKAWTSLPNNLIDPDKTNDSAQINFKMGLPSGTYTVGGTSPDYATLKDVVDELNNYGVCGPVIFNIRTGTYNEQMVLKEIPGSSATNTVTFTSETGNKNDVTISAAASASVTDNYVVRLDGTDNIVFENLTLERTGTGTYSTVISINGTVENIKINNNIIRGPLNTATDASGFRSNIFGETNATTNGIVITNNQLESNSNGIWLNTSTTKQSSGTKVANNTITANYTGVFLAGQYYPEIYLNTITRFDQTINVDFFGISLNIIDSAYNVYQNTITSNRGYGIRLRASNGYSGKEGLVINNMVTMNYAGSSSVFGFSSETSGSYQLFAHNTGLLNVDYTSSTSTTLGARVFYMPTSAGFSDIRILNNIFYSSIDGVAAYFTTTNIASVTELDYNLYYAGGAPNLTYISVYLADLDAHKAASGKAKNAYSYALTFAGAANAHISFMQNFAFGRNDLNIPIDIDGDIRCTALPTIGADEYNPGLGLPVATFIGPNKAVTGDRSYFLFNGNANQIAIYKWYVNGVLSSTALNLIYNFPTAGNYDITLVAENCTGKDSSTLSFVIADPTVAPTSNFSSDRNQIFINESVQLTDLSTDGPTAWHWSVTQDNGTNVIFSDSTEQDPFILFIEEGAYEICLITDNAVGSSAKRCRTAYIEVYPQTSMCASNTSTFIKGKIFDDGGAGGNYGINKNCTYFINPCASEVNLKFNLWTPTDVDDKLIIYDGDTTDAANIIATVTGGMTNPGGTTGFTAKSGRMWLVWRTDATLQNEGFEAEWSSVPTTINATVANFNIPDTLFVDAPADFINTSSGNGLTYFWDFDYPNYEPDDNNSYGKINPTKTFPFAGKYTILLESTNCLGSDTITKSIVVVAPAVAPSPVDFTASLLKVNTQEVTRLSDISGNGPTNWKWEISPSNGVIFLDAETSRNPRVIFNFGGTYTVKLVVANAIGADSTVKANFIEVLEYCQPNVLTVNTDVTIRRVVFEGIDQSSDYGVSKYSDFTGNAQVGEINKGGSHTISIERNTNNELANFVAWIDYNQDGDFEDADERILFDSASTAQILTATVNIPANVQLGQTRLRVAISRANLTTKPCGPVVVGEYEDYKVNISADNIAPVITLVGAATPSIEVGYGFIDSGATAFDNVDGNITSKIVVTGSVDTLVVNKYTLTYTITDTSGNTAFVTRTVTITPDVTLPVLTRLGADTVVIDVNTPYTEAGATAIDNPFGTNLNSSIVVTGAVDTTKVGVYVLTYTVADASGNTTNSKRWVIVQDTIKPVLTLIGNATITHDAKTPYVDAGATVTDNYDNIITYTATGTVNVNVLGANTIVYKAVDANGNVADSVVRTINVVDRFAPTIKLKGNDIINLARWQNYTDELYTLSDNFDDSSQITVTVLGTWVNSLAEGSFYIQYQATDLSGNTSLSEKRFIDVRGTNSVADIDTKNTKVYPNPNNGSFSIEANQAFEAGTTITVTNVLGATVYKTQPAQGSQKVNIALDAASAGIYFVNISNGTKTETTKIVVR